MEEDIIWKEIKEHKAEAFVTLYKNYYQYLFVYGYSLCGDKEFTKDCLHEIFLEIWSRKDELPKVSHVGAYLKTYTRRKIIRTRTDSKLMQLNEDVSDRLEVQLPYEDLLVATESSKELKERIESAIQKLTKTQIEIIRLKFFEAKSYDEIASITQTTSRTVYNHVYTSLKALRGLLHLIIFSIISSFFFQF